MKKLDLYIIKKFLGTFFLSIVLILMIVVVFDISERMEDFIAKKPPLKEIIFDYYFNFLPFFANLFSPLFTFIAVIYFTSRMAYRSEIIAILGSGVSFKRLLRPYLLSATAIALLSLYFNHYVIPKANKTRLAFEEIYLHSPYQFLDRNIHVRIAPDTYAYFAAFDNNSVAGSYFALEKIQEGKRNFYLKADRIFWDSIKGKWTLQNFFERKINGMNEKIKTGLAMDTIINISPAEFKRRENRTEAMQTPELTGFISEEKQKGSHLIPFYEVEKYRRSSFPFATFVLTLIGATVASRKVRGGIGWHIGVGLTISFSYILFMQVSTTFATNGGMPALIAVWIPNVIFTALALYMLRFAPK
ncbi:MAG: LptF/LptG family permease [Bacteroidetes bacterium]|nr:LptF/LptG family permease [Bacteroidota bacterium]